MIENRVILDDNPFQQIVDCKIGFVILRNGSKYCAVYNKCDMVHNSVLHHKELLEHA